MDAVPAGCVPPSSQVLGDSTAADAGATASDRMICGFGL